MKARPSRTDGLVLHHTYTSESKTKDDIIKIHQNKGMETVGYNWLIKRGLFNISSVKTGRPTIYQGGHCYLHKTDLPKHPEANGDQQFYNKYWLSVALIGDYENNPINTMYYNNVIGSIADIMKKNNLKRLRGHRECKATACPGKFIDMDKVRADVSKKIGFVVTK